jgi:hypothetical protein
VLARRPIWSEPGLRTPSKLISELRTSRAPSPLYSWLVLRPKGQSRTP